MDSPITGGPVTMVAGAAGNLRPKQSPAAQDALWAGWAARYRAEAFSANPHPLGGSASRAWSRGWNGADRLIDPDTPAAPIAGVSDTTSPGLSRRSGRHQQHQED